MCLYIYKFKNRNIFYYTNSRCLQVNGHCSAGVIFKDEEDTGLPVYVRGLWVLFLLTSSMGVDAQDAVFLNSAVLLSKMGVTASMILLVVIS